MVLLIAATVYGGFEAVFVLQLWHYSDTHLFSIHLVEDTDETNCLSVMQRGQL